MRPCVINPIPQKSADKRIPPRPTRAERIVAFKEPVSVVSNDVEGGDKVPCPSLKVAELEWSVDCTESLELLNVEVSLVALRQVFEAVMETTTSTAAAVVPQYASIGLVVTPAVKYTSYDSYAAVPFDVILGRLDKDAVMANPSDATTTLVRQQYEGPVTVRVTISIHNCTFTGGEGQLKELLARVGGSEMGAVSVRLTQGEMPKATQWRPIIYRRWFEVKDVPNSTSNNGGGEAAASGDNCAQFEASVAYPPTNPFYREHRAKQAHARLKRLAGAAAAAGAAEAAAVMAAEEESEDGGLIPLTKAEKKKMAKKEKKGSKSANSASAEKEENDELCPPVLVAPAVPITPTPPTATSPKFRLLAGSVVEARAVSTCGKFVRWARPSTLTKSQIANYLPTSEDTSSRRNGARQEPASTLTAAGRVVVYDTPSSSSPPHFAGIDYEVIGGGETPMHQVKMYTRRLVAPTHQEATLLHTPSTLDCRSTFLYPHTGATRLAPLTQGEAREAIALVPCGQHLFVQWADAANDGQLSKMAQKGTIRHSSSPSSHIGLVHAYNGTHLATSNYFTAEGESKLLRSAKKGGAKVVAAKSIDAEKEDGEAPGLIAADVIPTEQDPHWVCGPEALGHSWSVVATVGWQPASTASVETLGEVHHSVPAPTPAATTTTATAAARVEGESSETIVTSKPLTDEQAAAARAPPSSGDSSSSPPPPQLVEYYIGQRLHRTIAFFAPSSLLINEPTITLRSDWPSHIGSTANSQKTKQVTIPKVGDLRVGAAETDVKNTVHLNQVSAFLKACQDMHEHDPRSNNSRRFRFFRGAVKDVMIPRTDVPTATKDEWSSRRLMDWNEIRAAVAVHIGSVRSTGFDLEAHLASQEMSEGSTNDSKGDEEDAAVASKSAKGSEVVGSAGTQRGTSPSPRDNTAYSTSTAAAASNHSSTTTTGQQNGLETGVVFVQWADGTFSCASSPAGLHLVEVNPVRPEDVQFTSPLPLTPEDIASGLDGEDALHAAVRTDRLGVLRTPMMVRRSTSPDVIDISVQESTRNRKREEAKERRNVKKQRAAGGGGSHGSPNSSKSGKGQHRKQGRPYYDHGEGDEDDEEGGSYSDDEYDGDSYDEEGDHDGEEEGSSDFDSEEDEDSDVSSTFSMRREREAEKGGIIDPSLMPASMREKLRNNTIPMSDLPQIDLGDNKKHKKGEGKKHRRHRDEDSEEEWESEGDDNHAYDYGGGSMDGDSYDDDEDYDSDDEEDDSAFETTQTSAGGEEGDSLVGSSAFDTEYDYDSGYNSSDMYCDEDTNELKNYKNGQLSDEAYSYEEGWSTESAEGESEGDDQQAAPTSTNTAVGKKRARGATTNTPPTTKKGGKKSVGAPAATKQPMSVRGRKLEPSPPQSKKKSTKANPAIIPTKVAKATATKGSSTKKKSAAASSSTPPSSSSQAKSSKGGATKKDGAAKKDKKDIKKKK